MVRESRLIIVSNRLPVTLKCTNAGGTVQQASIEDFRGFFHRKTDQTVVPSPDEGIVEDTESLKSLAVEGDPVLANPSIATPMSPAASKARAASLADPIVPGQQPRTRSLSSQSAQSTGSCKDAAADSGDAGADEIGEWTYSVSSGGLVSALTGLKNKGGVTFEWVGWPGTDVPAAAQAHVTSMISETNARPVFLTEEEADLHYNGFSNSVMWPLLHYQVPEMNAVYEWFDGYKVANRKFAEEVASQIEDGDLVWVHDYHLMLLPVMLRQLSQKKFKIGFFLHTSFPSSDMFRVLPMRAELLNGVLGADLLGFHTYDYARHFLSTCSRVLGYDTTSTTVKVDMRTARIGVFPIGIEPEKFVAALEDPDITARIAQLRAKFDGRRIIVGVDRMDYIKGIPQKLLAFERFLRDNPDLRSKSVLVQICVPSRQDVPEYQELAAQVDRLVGRINGVYGAIDWCPIHYLHRSVTFPELVALYAAADACLITSLRDGMNLVSYEYVVSQRDNHGQLILSEFAGAAQSMDGAIVINPYNVETVADAIKSALTMAPEARASAHSKVYTYVSEHTAATWGTAFVEDLQEDDGSSDNHVLPPLSTTDTAASFRGADGVRVILVDCDGVLTRFSRDTSEAPHAKALASLKCLCSRPNTAVYVLSGRSRANLESWFGASVPGIGLVAEHGLFVRHPGADSWVELQTDGQTTSGAENARSARGTPVLGASEDSGSGSGSGYSPRVALSPQPRVLSSEWQPAALDVLRYYTERTPGSRFDVKDESLTWHFRGADPEFGSWQALRVRTTLENVLLRHRVEVVSGSRALEIRPAGAHRGLAVREIAMQIRSTGGAVGFALAIGDNLSSAEGVHSSLPHEFFGAEQDSRCFTCTMSPPDGKGKDAGFYIAGQEEVVDLLDALGDDSN